MEEITLKRLLFTKRLFNHGVQHSNKNSELERFLAIHHFDNAIELFLKTIALREVILTSNKQDFKFKDLFNQINNKLELKTPNYKLPLKDQIFTLHDTRNLAQHQGDAPSFSTIIKYHEYTKDFLYKCFKDIFKIDFDKIYASFLVENEDIKKLLVESEKNIEESNFKKSIELSVKSFNQLKFNENSYPKVTYISKNQIDIPGKQFEQKFISFIAELNKILKANERKVENLARILEEDFAILKLGVDYKEYEHFDEIRKEFYNLSVAPLSEFFDIPSTIAEEEKKYFNEENALFCHEFVLETVLKLQGFAGKHKI